MRLKKYEEYRKKISLIAKSNNGKIKIDLEELGYDLDEYVKNEISGKTPPSVDTLLIKSCGGRENFILLEFKGGQKSSDWEENSLERKALNTLMCVLPQCVDTPSNSTGLSECCEYYRRKDIKLKYIIVFENNHEEFINKLGKNKEKIHRYLKEKKTNLDIFKKAKLSGQSYEKMRNGYPFYDIYTVSQDSFNNKFKEILEH